MIDTADLEERSGKGTGFSSFQLFPDGNICMIFERPLPEGMRTIIKVHNRLGIRRQCSFTAVDSRVISAFLDRNELYAFMLEAGDRLTLNRLEPDTKENIFPLEPGEPVQIIALSRDDILIAYEDRVIRYMKGKAEIREASMIALDSNRGPLFRPGRSPAGFTFTRDGSMVTFEEGRLTAADRHGEKSPVFEESYDDCRLLRDNLALKKGQYIYLYKIY